MHCSPTNEHSGSKGKIRKVRELLETVRAKLDQAGFENAEREAAWILEAATGLTRHELVTTGASPTAEQTQAALASAERRAGGEPLQYVTGVAGFRRLELSVGPGVFIPRPETEMLAERAMSRLPEDGVCVEIGTGSGAVALSIKDERPNVQVVATEYSADALAWAARNRDRLGLDVEMVQGDLTDPLAPRLKGAVDVIVSNPPYVPEGFTLGREVMDFEPHVALFARDDGLEIVQELVERSKEWLADGGWLILEIGEVQRDAVAAILRDAGYGDVGVHPDLTGRPRIAEGSWTHGS